MYSCAELQLVAVCQGLGIEMSKSSLKAEAAREQRMRRFEIT